MSSTIGSGLSPPPPPAGGRASPSYPFAIITGQREASEFRTQGQKDKKPLPVTLCCGVLSHAAPVCLVADLGVNHKGLLRIMNMSACELDIKGLERMSQTCYI